MSDQQDVLKRAYASLLSLKGNLPNEHPNNTVDIDTAEIYGKQLDALSSIGIDVEEFRIPHSMLGSETTEINYMTHETAATGNTNLKLGYLKTKLDSLLTYFELNTSSGDKPTIGFHA